MNGHPEARSYTLHQIHMWYALSSELIREDRLTNAHMLMVANRGDKDDVEGLFNFLKG